MRIKLDHDIDPGQCVSKKIPVILSKAETFYLGIDMVSEQVTWFEFLGNEVSLIRLNPEKNH
ncbi:MAG: hypothetical protein A2161_10175 [Candidatus Schekmanbacteria bacterium RBG_13_48_7]|uniref:Uncharacterized protein n=1 Tax=Candidatus Schekmanbacteria bacterium RBG_13_48_7 TaxID=1817878 RepID=A0A1F7S2D2_9BACT|nr:MAG: hypothetical protein A2161_10175 [Candidatus Schekmanbacteria bacterium RBG_13_48_7]